MTDDVLPSAEALADHWMMCCDPDCSVLQTLQARLVADRGREQYAAPFPTSRNGVQASRVLVGGLP